MKNILTILFATFFLNTFTHGQEVNNLKVQIIQKGADTIKVKNNIMTGFPVKSDEVWIRIYQDEKGKKVEYKIISMEVTVITNFGHETMSGTYRNKYITGDVLKELKSFKSGDKIQISSLEIATPMGQKMDGGTFELTAK